MLKLQKKGTLKAVSPRREWHDDQHLPALTVKLAFEAVKLEVVETGLIANFSCVYDKGNLALEDVASFKVLRKIQNVDVTIAGEKFKGADIDGIIVSPSGGRIADVELTVKMLCDPKQTGVLHANLLDVVSIALTQRQLELPIDEKEDPEE